jgi:transposase
MKTVELYARVRHAVLIEGISERGAAERFGINARTVAKMLKFSVPPGYVRRKQPFRPKLDEFTGVINAILASDRERPKKQRHTSKRIFGAPCCAVHPNCFFSDGPWTTKPRRTKAYSLAAFDLSGAICGDVNGWPDATCI